MVGGASPRVYTAGLADLSGRFLRHQCNAIHIDNVVITTIATPLHPPLVVRVEGPKGSLQLARDMPGGALGLT
eukprot:COSAG01_NODE_6023_length_3896_cov_1.483013_1_plen_72_part_10